MRLDHTELAALDFSHSLNTLWALREVQYGGGDSFVKAWHCVPVQEHEMQRVHISLCRSWTGLPVDNEFISFVSSTRP